MKILIDLTPLYGRKWTGVELYAIDLYRALLKTSHTVIPIFYTQNDIDRNMQAIIVAPCNRIMLENIHLSKVIRNVKVDVALFPIFPPPIDLYLNRPCKIVPIIHDTAFIEYHTTLKFAAKYYLTPKYKLALKYSNYIVTISEDAKMKIRKYSSLPVINWKENISNDYQSSNLNITIQHLKPFGLIKENYYISVSTIEPRKNLKYLLQSIRKNLSLTGKKLVLVGRKGWGKDNELNKLIEDLGQSIIFTEYIPLNVLQSLYHYAYAFVLLSVEEGFGRTPLEAIACGCNKIIVSDIPIFHETLELSANYIPLNNITVAEKKFLAHKWNNVPKNFKIPFDALEKSIKFI